MFSLQLPPLSLLCPDLSFHREYEGEQSLERITLGGALAVAEREMVFP